MKGVAPYSPIRNTISMPNYRRAFVPSATYFFTVNLLRRQSNDLLIRHVDVLREVIRSVKQRPPFQIHAWVILPDHMHCIWELPEGDADFSTRWRLIKSDFSKTMPVDERRSIVRQARGERGIWQRRFWEHLIRDDEDFKSHMDYVHINPLKLGYVTRVADWPHSAFQALVKKGIYPLNWAGDGTKNALSYEE
jgi:putative transposase